jgi:hypothetical protein
MRALTSIFGLAFAILANARELDIPAELQIAAFALAVEAPQPSQLMFCLQVGGADPSSEVISSVAQRYAGVVPGSECAQGRRDVTVDDGIVRDLHTGSYYKATKRAALFVRLSEYQRVDNTHATIQLVTNRHGVWANGSTLLLEATPNGLGCL